MAGVSEVASKAGVGTEAVKAVFNAILALTREDQKVTIQGIGSFSKVHKDARTGRNPATNEALEIPAKDVFHFKPTKGIDMSVPKPAGGRRR